MQEGLILSGCIKVINLITSLPFAQSWNKKEKKKHQWDFENIFTQAEAESVSANIGFLLWRQQMGRGNIRPGENYDKVRPQKEKIW